MRYLAILLAIAAPACAEEPHAAHEQHEEALDKQRMDDAERAFLVMTRETRVAIDEKRMDARWVSEAEVYYNRARVAIRDVQQAFDDEDAVKYEWALGQLALNVEKMRVLTFPYPGGADDPE